MGMKKFVAIFVVVTLVLSNVLSPEPDERYSNASGSFTYMEVNRKQKDFEVCLYKFGAFKRHDKNADTMLYRLDEKKLYKFWNYTRYFISPKYQLPYSNWQDILDRRSVLENKSGFQDF